MLQRCLPLLTGIPRAVPVSGQSAGLLSRLCANRPVGLQRFHQNSPQQCTLHTPSVITKSNHHKSTSIMLSRNFSSKHYQTLHALRICQLMKCQQTVLTRNSSEQSWNIFSIRNCAPTASRFTLLSGVAPMRFASSSSRTQHNRWQHRNKSVMLYVVAGAVLVVGFSYAAVPLYTLFCQATGLGGQPKVGHDTDKVDSMTAVTERKILIRFNADTAASMRWNFRPQQSEVTVMPGETALAFYSAMNPTQTPIVGISTYNVVPFEAGQYFNKIQCFCFEEQILNPHEQVDMPVFFFIDPDFADDPKMEKVQQITLSYTFFESKEGLELPDPMSR